MNLGELFNTYYLILVDKGILKHPENMTEKGRNGWNKIFDYLSLIVILKFEIKIKYSIAGMVFTQSSEADYTQDIVVDTLVTAIEGVTETFGDFISECKA